MYGNKKMSGQDIYNLFEKHLPDIFKHLRGIVSIYMISTIPKLEKRRISGVQPKYPIRVAWNQLDNLKKVLSGYGFLVISRPTRAKLILQH